MLDAALRERYGQWWRRANDSPLVLVTAWDGAPAPPEPADNEAYWLDFPSRLERHSYWFEHTHHAGEAFPCLFVNFGPGVLGACMGGKYAFDRHTFWFTAPVLEDLEWIEEFRVRPDNVWLRRIWEFTEYALERAGGRFLVGVTDIGGGMDVLAGLRGTENLLVDLVERPEAVKRALAVVYEEWWSLYAGLAARLLDAQGAVPGWNTLYADDRSYPLQNDFSCMISAAQFRAFDVPFLEDLCGRLTYALYHLDGPGAVQHAPALCEIEQLNAIQWIPGAGAPGGDTGRGGMHHWLDLLRQIQAAGKGLELYVHPEEAVSLAAELRPQGLLMKTYAGSRADAERLLERIREQARARR